MQPEHPSQPFPPNGNGNQPQSLPVVYPASYESDEDELNLSQLLAALRRRALVIAGVAITVTSAALLWGLTRTPQYEGKFELLVEPVTQANQLNNLPAIAQQAASLLGGESKTGASGLDYETQIAVLQSPKLMFPVIERLQTRYPEIRYDSLIGIGSNKLNIAQREETKIIEVIYQDPDPQKAQFVLDQVATAYLDYSVQDRRTNLRQGLQFVEDQIPRLRLRVSVLEDQLQGFLQQHNLADPGIEAQQTAGQATALRQQRTANQAELKRARSLYESLRKQLGLQPNEAIAASALSEDTQYQDLLTELQKVQALIATESARFSAASPTIQNLRDQQRNLLSTLRQESQRVVGKRLSGAITDPQVLASQNSVRLNLTQQLADAANQIQAIEAQDRAIVQAQNRINRQIKQFPALARQYTDLVRDLQVTTETLNQLLAKRETLRVENAQQDVPWEIIAAPTVLRDEAGQPIPVSPKIPLYVGLGAILGLLLGGVTALILESLSSILHTPEEIKDITGLPVLGAIPFSQDREQLSLTGSDQQELLRTGDSKITPAYHDSPFLEAFRALNTNIRNLSSYRATHSLVISSAMSGEGKSTVAVHLAHAAAEMGQRVLLVDSNLRHPQIHTWFGLSNFCGLANIIATKSSRRSAVQQSPANSNLFILTAGESPSNPTLLLATREMQNLMEQLQAEFDLVIYDTPSVLGFTDSSLLTPHVDGVVLVVAVNQTNSSQLTHALEQVRTAQAQVLGFIANGATRSTATYPLNSQPHPPKLETKPAKLLARAVRLLR